MPEEVGGWGPRPGLKNWKLVAGSSDEDHSTPRSVHREPFPSLTATAHTSWRPGSPSKMNIRENRGSNRSSNRWAPPTARRRNPVDRDPHRRRAPPRIGVDRPTRYRQQAGRFDTPGVHRSARHDVRGWQRGPWCAHIRSGRRRAPNTRHDDIPTHEVITGQKVPL